DQPADLPQADGDPHVRRRPRDQHRALRLRARRAGALAARTAVVLARPDVSEGPAEPGHAGQPRRRHVVAAAAPAVVAIVTGPPAHASMTARLPASEGPDPAVTAAIPYG